MKSKFRLLLFALLSSIIVVLSGCVCSKGTLLPSDQYEPNDTKLQAAPLIDSIQATQNETDPDDFFKFDGIKNETVQIDLAMLEEGSPTLLDVQISTVQDQILEQETLDFRTLKTLQFSLPDTGTYYIRIRALFKGPADSISGCAQATYKMTLRHNAPIITLSNLPAPNKSNGYAWDQPIEISGSALDPGNNTPINYRWTALSLTTRKQSVIQDWSVNGDLSWTPLNNSDLFGADATSRSDCSYGQAIKLTIEAKNSLGKIGQITMPAILIFPLCNTK